MIFDNMSRDQLREMYRSAWRKFKAEQPLSPLEKQIVAVIKEHPEYRVIIESAPAPDRGKRRALERAAIV